MAGSSSDEKKVLETMAGSSSDDKKVLETMAGSSSDEKKVLETMAGSSSDEKKVFEAMAGSSSDEKKVLETMAGSSSFTDEQRRKDMEEYERKYRQESFENNRKSRVLLKEIKDLLAVPISEVVERKLQEKKDLLSSMRNDLVYDTKDIDIMKEIEFRGILGINGRSCKLSHLYDHAVARGFGKISFKEREFHRDIVRLPPRASGAGSSLSTSPLAGLITPGPFNPPGEDWPYDVPDSNVDSDSDFE